MVRIRSQRKSAKMKPLLFAHDKESAESQSDVRVTRLDLRSLSVELHACMVLQVLQTSVLRLRNDVAEGYCWGGTNTFELRLW